MNSIMDRLEGEGHMITAEDQDNEEIIVPKVCAFCKNNAICSVLPTFISLNKIGIIVGIEACPYQQSTKKSPSQSTS